jgi:hypothetical protein
MWSAERLIRPSRVQACLRVALAILLAGSSFGQPVDLAGVGSPAPQNLGFPNPPNSGILLNSDHLPSSSVTAAVPGLHSKSVYFEANEGQTDPSVRYFSRGPGFALFLRPQDAVISLYSREPGLLRRAAIRMTWGGGGGSETAEMVASELAPAVSHYVIGRGQAREVRTYRKVAYRNTLAGIDLVFHGNQSELEYDFVVQPGADPSRIRLRFEGGNNLRVDSSGGLVLSTPCGDLRQRRPVAFQQRSGERVPVPVDFRILSTEEAGFELGQFDPELPLVIDPILEYSTYHGGGEYDEGWAVAVDSRGNAYLAGVTASADFPVTTGALSTSLQHYDVFLSKFNARGSELIFSTYIGGTGNESVAGLVVDSNGAIYIAGSTDSVDFPASPGAYQAQYSCCGGDTFLLKLGPNGKNVLYATYFGGSGPESALGLAVDPYGFAYLAGVTESGDLPTTAGAVMRAPKGNGDVFVARFNQTGTELVYSTYLGGSGPDQVRAVFADSQGNATIAGVTESVDFPVTANAYSRTLSGTSDVYILRLNPSASAYHYSTYLGGSGNETLSGLAVTSAGEAVVTGSTSSLDLPVTTGAYCTTAPAGTSGYLIALNNAGTQVAFGSYLPVVPSAVGLGPAGSLHLAGSTASNKLPVTADALQAALRTGGDSNRDAFLMRMAPAAAGITYASYLGGTSEERLSGLAVDAAGNAFLTGLTRSSDFPTTAGARQSEPRGRETGGVAEAFLAKIPWAAGTAKVTPAAVGTFREGQWMLDQNNNGAWDGPATDSAFGLGQTGGIPFVGDWNGDGRTKAGVYANGLWFLDYDGNGVWDGGVNDKLVAWGWDGATPFVGDWNGDGRTKIGVFNKGFWFLDYDGNYSWNDVKPFAYGWDGATPLVGDWNGDGRTDVGVYNIGFWFLDYNGDYLWDNGVQDKIVAWGWPGSTPIIGDWNGDGRSKIGAYAGGYWYPDYEGSYKWEYPNKGTIWIVGWTGATPVIGDWNGDGKNKAGAFFNGYWYLDYNGNGVFEGAETDRIYAVGHAGDTPVVGRW